MDDTDVGFLDRPDITGRLPGYQLVSQLAETAMSEVFLAVDTAHANRRVVVKVVGEDLLRQPTFRERFDRESHIALTLHHPNVVPAYAAGESDDGRLCYLVMRYVEGANLARVLHERGPLSFAETLDVVRQVAHAVDFAHQQGLVHRDIKPANILVERDTGHVYVCDFGIAKNLASRTVTILGPGTPFYAAPEQLEGGEVTPRSDVYSLARVALHCLTGTVDPVHLPNTPVNRVLRKAMAKDPERRHATCADLVRELESGRRRQRARRLSLAVGAPALATAALLVLWLLPAISSADLARIPAALRDCRGSGQTLTCGDATGQEATFTLYQDHLAMYAAYDQAVAESRNGTQTNCPRMYTTERRYPDVGPMRGHVVCHVRDGVTTVIWTDEDTVTLGRARAGSIDLRDRWAGWVGADVPFPAPEEAVLWEVTAADKDSCLRAQDLDKVPGAVAGITCSLNLPGVDVVSYYRFRSVPELAGMMDGMVASARESNTATCEGVGGSLGVDPYEVVDTTLGRSTCNIPLKEIDWSMEPLLYLGKVRGTDVKSVADWWFHRYLTPLPRIFAALNAQRGSRPTRRDSSSATFRTRPVRRAHGRPRTKYAGTSARDRSWGSCA
ncbi:hypothetical protein GCM10029964_072490 [Kibdelosporangium lantanae]